MNSYGPNEVETVWALTANQAQAGYTRKAQLEAYLFK